MNVRKLKNPTIKDATFVFNSVEYTVKAGKAEPFPGEIVQFYLQHVNGPLVEPEEIKPAEAKEGPKDVK